MERINKLLEVFCKENQVALFNLPDTRGYMALGAPHTEMFFKIEDVWFHFDCDQLLSYSDEEFIQALQDGIDEDSKRVNFLKTVKWEKNFLFTALHKVGDDYAKAGIEDELQETFQGDVLDQIAKIFAKYTTDWK